ncbi:MAG: UDP-N-acetylmuramate--L-alanine ligase [Clostridia bacterium]|nr:UDP-N-acetylmuramate--L-alanine ligase [Clostridia bacterium]
MKKIAQNYKKPQKYYFIGIGGVGMSSLAFFLLSKGKKVCGCDRQSNEYVDRLKKLGVDIQLSICPQPPQDVDVCVVSGAILNEDFALTECIRRNIPIVSRAQLLGKVLTDFKNSIAIAGSHGKTTTTALCYHAFSSCKIFPTLFLGGDFDGKNFFDGNSDFCIAEACEYKNSFLSLNPLVSVILNVDYDHVDFFDSFNKYQEAFVHFAKNTQQNGIVVAQHDFCENLVRQGVDNLVGFGVFDTLKELTSANCDYSACNITQKDAKYSFDLYVKGKKIMRVDNCIEGKHLVNSSLVVFAIAHYFGLDLNLIKESIKTFKGVDRRWQKFHSSFTNVIADYAHHPTEIKNLIATAKKLGYDKIYLLFQPHTYSRTKALLSDFSTCFDGVDKLVLLPVYSARETPVDGITSDELMQKIQNVPTVMAKDLNQAKDMLKCATMQDLLLVVGAGDLIEFCTQKYLI